MAEVLSQSQIDELLNNLNRGEIDIQEIESNEKKIKEYDFRSPKKITKETTKLINGIYESYCRFLSSQFTSMLRLMCDITVEQVEESRFNEYNNALEDSVLMGLVNVKYPDGTVSDSKIFMEFSRSLSFVIIDRLLGGSGEEYDIDRDYSDIELTLLGKLFDKIVPKMGKTWENTIEMYTEFEKIETNARFIQSINYNDAVEIVILNAVINNLSGKITICIPSMLLDEISKKSNIFAKNKKKKADLEDQKQAIMDSLKTTDLTVTGVLGKAEASLYDIINMKIGDVIVLDKGIKSDVDVNVDGEKWFEGKWGIKRKKGVIKINKILH